MNVLEISAEVEYQRAVPHYLPADCRQTLRAFVDGAIAAEKEFQALERFRKSLVTIISDALAQADSESPEPPYARLTLTAGEHCQDPADRFTVFVERHDDGKIPVWELMISHDRAEPLRIFGRVPEDVLKALKIWLDEATGRWASTVVFERVVGA